MSRFFATFLEELEARTAIEDCLKRFARAVDRQDWKAAREAYHDGAFDDHGFFKDVRLDPKGMQTVLALRSKFSEAKRTLDDPGKYIDTSYRDKALAR